MKIKILKIFILFYFKNVIWSLELPLLATISNSGIKYLKYMKD